MVASSTVRSSRYTSVETRDHQEREAALRALAGLDRRAFLKVSLGAMGEDAQTTSPPLASWPPYSDRTPYPKFQTQMGRVVLLRDMINGCPMHPMRAAPMEADDPRMRSMEAYIISQRAGKVMAYGKH